MGTEKDQFKQGMTHGHREGSIQTGDDPWAQRRIISACMIHTNQLFLVWSPRCQLEPGGAVGDSRGDSKGDGRGVLGDSRGR